MINRLDLLRIGFYLSNKNIIITRTKRNKYNRHPPDIICESKERDELSVLFDIIDFVERIYGITIMASKASKTRTNITDTNMRINSRII